MDLFLALCARDPFLIREQKRMVGWIMDGRTSKQGSCPFVFWPPILHVNNWTTRTRGRALALECVQLSQMTTIYPNILVGVRERASTYGGQTVLLAYSARLKNSSLIGVFGAM